MRAAVKPGATANASLTVTSTSPQTSILYMSADSVLVNFFKDKLPAAVVVGRRSGDGVDEWYHDGERYFSAFHANGCGWCFVVLEGVRQDSQDGIGIVSLSAVQCASIERCHPARSFS